MDDKIRDLIDQNEIQQLLRHYTEMVDKRDWKRMDQIFATDGTRVALIALSHYDNTEP